MDDLISRLDALVEERSLLKHPFYRAWSAGELTREALGRYAREYFHLVRAVPELVEAVRERAPESMHDDLAEHRDEEAEHVDAWLRFAAALGIDEAELDSHTPRSETTEAVAGMQRACASSYDAGAAALYALELEIPRIAATKMEGLERFYGIGSDDALDYFRLHAEADVRHAATWRHQLAASEAPEAELTAAAEQSLDAQNLLLDGCVAGYGSRTSLRVGRMSRTARS